MKKVFVFIFFGLLFAFTIQTNVERALVKTATDADAVKINYSPKKASIMQLTALSRPPVVPAAMGRVGLEFSTFKLNCLIKTYSYEKDFVKIILAEPKDTSLTMLAEVPIKGFDSVKTQLGYCRLKIQKYEVSGVFFYGNNKEKAAAKNGVEICPVIGIKPL